MIKRQGLAAVFVVLSIFSSVLPPKIDNKGQGSNLVLALRSNVILPLHLRNKLFHPGRVYVDAIPRTTVIWLFQLIQEDMGSSSATIG
jgi:hypothetical protein